MEGQHVIQLSTGLAPADVERAVAHAFARVIVIHERAMMGDHPDGAGPVLTAQETGRLAEVRVLSRQLAEHPQRAAELHREILALAEQLGVTRSGADGASALERLKPNLDAAAVEALVAAAHAKPREREHLERAIVVDQQQDLERAALRTISRPAAYDLAGPGRRANEAQLQAFADAAARHRALVSERTLAGLRTRSAKVPAGKYLRIMDAIQIGGGASLAGREPSTLLIDARGRWQADANETIAQTAQQLMELAKAEFGDVRQVARPNERVSVAALRFWEDTIATRGPVVDGIASPRMDRDGRMLLEIQPSDGSAMLTIEVGGTETFATGFTPEFVPGAARQSMADSVWELEQGLKAVQNGQASSPELQDAATIALAKLQRVERPRRGDAAVIEHALAGPHGAELRAHLSQKALLAVDATTTWNELEAAPASAPQVALGDDANLTARTARMFPADPGAWHPRHVIMAGIGGTAISAAEVILAHPDTRITMYGKETPAGLLENDQFKTLARNFGTPETLAALGFESHTPAIRPALTIVQIDRYLVAPVVTVEADGRRAFQAFEGAAATGDAYVAAIGRGEQLPPEIADLVLAARRAKQVVVFKAKLDHDGQYVGYTVALGPEQARKIVLVTGAASRGAPMAEFSLSDQALIKAASARDAHAKSGNFDGGFVSSAVQTKKGAAANAAQ